MATYSRADWGARPPKVPQPHLDNVPYGAVHHIGGGPAYPGDVFSTLRGIQAYEQSNGYVDIAYCWGVDRDGNLYELRGDVKDGATLGYSGTSFSVLAICNAAAPDFVATPQLINGIAACFQGAIGRGICTNDVFVEGHHWFDSHVTQYPTDCPGGLEQQIHDIQNLIHAPAPAPAPPPEPPKPKGDTLSIQFKCSNHPAIGGKAGNIFTFQGDGVSYRPHGSGADFNTCRFQMAAQNIPSPDKDHLPDLDYETVVKFWKLVTP